MKTKNLVLLSLFALALSGCAKEPASPGMEPNRVDGPVFDFATTTTSTLNFKYDVPEGYIVGFDVYAEYPYETNAEGQQVLKAGIAPVERAFTDAKGAYNRPIELPSYVKTIYICTRYAGVKERMLVAQVGTAGIEVEAVQSAAPLRTTRAAAVNMNTIESSYADFDVPGRTTLMLGKWHLAKDGPNYTYLATGYSVRVYGRPVEMSYVDKKQFGENSAKDALKIDAKVLRTINTALLGDDSGVPVDQKYLKSGDIHVTKEAELDLIFIQNWGSFHNTLVYYCYDTQNPPQSIEQIKYQVLAIPNAMEYKYMDILSHESDVVSMFQGEGVRLKYVDAQGVLHDKFPAGTSVGWVLYRDGFVGKSFHMDPVAGPMQYYPGVGKLGANYSNPAFSVSPNTAVLKYGDFVIIGFDDNDGNLTNSGYRDYLDVVFNVQSTPSDAITDNVPDVGPEDPKPVTVSKQGVLLFEDNWPYQGDFDMNDMVVGYVARQTRNKDNAVTESKIDFTIKHAGASYNNSFAFADPNISNAVVTITGGEGAPAPEIDRTNNIVRLAGKVNNYANKAQKVTFTVNYKFNSPVASFEGLPFNPFITIGDDAGKEVHLTNNKPSSAADMSWFEKNAHDFSNPALNLFYVTFENPNAKVAAERGQQLPWAVNIAFDSEQAMNNFRVTTERKKVDQNYPGFTKWVQSNGKENADWYLNYKE